MERRHDGAAARHLDGADGGRTTTTTSQCRTPGAERQRDEATAGRRDGGDGVTERRRRDGRRCDTATTQWRAQDLRGGYLKFLMV
jgi:hypothetical protein